MRYESGITIARLEGRQKGERESKLKIASNMLKKGFSLEVIAKCSELSLAELSALKQSLNI